MKKEIVNEQEPKVKMNLPKINFPKVDPSKITSKPFFQLITKNLAPGMLCYIVLFVIAQFLFSSGKSYQNPYSIIALVIFLIASQVYFIKKENYSTWKETLVSAIVTTLLFAILDYLIVNLWLLKNNLELYKYWPYYFIYLTTLLLPVLRFKWDDSSSPTLKSLLTKK